LDCGLGLAQGILN